MDVRRWHIQQKSILGRIQKQKWDGFFMLVTKALAVSINKMK